MIATTRRGPVSRALLGCLLLVVLAGFWLLRSASARAATIPTDPAAHGFIGLCGIDGKPMTGGSVLDRPFVWKAVSSQPAQAEAQGAGKVATLYAYQPRPDVAAVQWSGDTLTATNTYSTTSAPTAQATKLDFRLQDFINEYPPMVDGLYELRMYYGNQAAPIYADSYAATFIQVSGQSWKVVQGGTVDCGKGVGVSSEIGALGTKSAGGTPTASAPFGGPSGTGVPKDARGVPVSGGGGTARSGAPSAAPATGTAPRTSARTSADDPPSATGSADAAVPSVSAQPGGGLRPGITISAGGAGTTDATQAAGRSTSGGGTSVWTVALIVAAAVVVAGAGGWFLATRRRA